MRATARKLYFRRASFCDRRRVIRSVSTNANRTSKAMKIFISWSGSRSRAVAELLSDWLRCVIQAARPWISTRDIDRGALWLGEINDQLRDTTTGIVCLTQENKMRPWILFEAGALAKGLSSNRVCTFLVDLQPADLEDPLAQFNHTFPERESVLSLVRTLNSSVGTQALDDRILEQVFCTYWPQFETKFADAINKHKAEASAKPRPKEDIMAEILENTRQLSSRIRRIEHTLPDRERMMMGGDSIGPEEAKEYVRDSMRAGMPVEIMIDRLSRRGVPMSFIREAMAEAGKDRSRKEESRP